MAICIRSRRLSALAQNFTAQEKKFNEKSPEQKQRKCASVSGGRRAVRNKIIVSFWRRILKIWERMREEQGSKMGRLITVPGFKFFGSAQSEEAQMDTH